MPGDQDAIICRCEEVDRSEILSAIEEGARTVDGVKRRTRAGMGLCQGKTCGRIVAKIIARETNQPIEEIKPAKYRPPVRSISVGVLANEKEE
jgi:NAD(P)H-nitrite reductase large subunit